MKEDRVLITGGDGFIGSNLIRELLKNNYKISTTSRKPLEETSLKDLRGKIDFHKLDLTNSNHVNLLIENIKPTVIIHLASIIDKRKDQEGVNNSMKNLQMSKNIYNACLNLEDLKIIINFGSAEEYGNNKSPLTESQKEIPTSPYSLSKTQIRILSTYFHNAHSLPITTLKPFSIFGENQSPTMLIPYMITQCLNNNPIETTPGQQTKDFIYVKDLISAIELVIENPKKELFGETINICSGEEVKVKDVILKIKELTKTNSEIKFTKSYNKSEAMRFYGSNKKAKKLLNWEPKYEFNEALEQTINWYKENQHIWNKD